MTMHTYRCPKCGTTFELRSATAVLTCQASTYCASRGVVMELRPCDSGDTLGSHNESDPGTPASARGRGPEPTEEV